MRRNATLNPRTSFTYRRRRSFDPASFGILAVGLLVVVFVAFGVVFSVYSSFHTAHQTCTVTGKERIYDFSNGHSSRHQRVYTEQCGTLEVGDSTLDGHFNSADTWAQIQKGHTYVMKTRGLRVGLFSMFPNIVSVQPADD